jgi:sugar lactone lactonase YvrE
MMASGLGGLSGCSDVPANPSGNGAGDAEAGVSYPPLNLKDVATATPVGTQEFYFTEGPVWDPSANVLYFTDINAHQGSIVGGAVYKFTPPSTFDVVVQPDGNADGLALDPKDRLFGAGFFGRDVWGLSSSNTLSPVAACMPSTDASPITVTDLTTGDDAATDATLDTDAMAAGDDGSVDAGVSDASADASSDASDAGATDAGPGQDATIVDAAVGDAAAEASAAQDAGAPEGKAGSCYMGQGINTPDDLTFRSDGVLYFTDPTFASGGQGFPTLDLPLAGAQGVYRLTTDGVLHLEDATAAGPNGVNLSPDEKTLYVSYTVAGMVAKFDVAADGSLSNKKTFATGTFAADSMCVDAAGNVYVGTLGGLAAFDPTGKSLGTINVGGKIVTNCAFGGADQRTLFITARTTATLSGAPPLGGGLLYQIADMPIPGIPGQN